VGTALTQVSMGLYPKMLRPETMVRVGLLLIITSSLFFSFLFEYRVPSWTVYIVCFVNGMGIGSIFTSYEIMVPQVIFYQQEIAAAHDQDSGMLENLVYGMVDSIRELSLSISFFVVGFILEHFSVSWASRLCCGYLPILLSLICLALHIYHPEIILTKDE
jgi:MFS family permease